MSITVLGLTSAEAWTLFYVGTIGVVLVLLRNWFMANAETLAAQSQFITVNLDILIGTVNVIADIVKLLISLVGGIASLFTRQPSFPPFVPSEIPFVNATAFEQACKELPRVCAEVDTPGKLFELALLPVASNATCGFFRYLYPTGWLFDTVYPVGQSLYLTYPPYPPGTGPNTTEFGNNCQCMEKYGCSYRWQCIALGSGYWLLEFVLPLILFGCMWNGWIECARPWILLSFRFPPLPRDPSPRFQARLEVCRHAAHRGGLCGSLDCRKDPAPTGPPRCDCRPRRCGRQQAPVGGCGASFYWWTAWRRRGKGGIAWGWVLRIPF